MAGKGESISKELYSGLKILTNLIFFNFQFEECKAIGRDAVRLLQDVNKQPEFDALWKDLLGRPNIFAPEFAGVHDLLGLKTPRKFLITRMTPEMENQLLFILKNVSIMLFLFYVTLFFIFYNYLYYYYFLELICFVCMNR